MHIVHKYLSFYSGITAVGQKREDNIPSKKMSTSPRPSQSVLLAFLSCDLCFRAKRSERNLSGLAQPASLAERT